MKKGNGILTLGFFLLFLNVQAQKSHDLRAGFMSNGNVNGVEVSAARNLWMDKAQTLNIATGLRLFGVYGAYSAINELQIRNRNNAYRDELISDEAALNAGLNLFVSVYRPLNKKWALRAEGDLFGIGIGNETRAVLTPGTAFSESHPGSSSEPIALSTVSPQLLNLFVPMTRSRGSLIGRMAVEYSNASLHTFSLGCSAVLRGMDSGAKAGGGSSLFRQTSYLPYIAYVWKMHHKN